MTMGAIPSRAGHLPYLDGLRGTASAWVFIYHIALLNAVQYPMLKEGPSAVDLFMMLSGFLMAFHYLEREAREPWDSPSTWYRFWVRRFFRIAPLYYVLLVVALIAGAWIGHARGMIATDQEQSLRLAGRYSDHSIRNWLTHLTFVFGFLPRFSYSNALPDWSIGLEMQFYMALPVLMLIWKRIGPIPLAILALLGSVLVYLLFPRYVRAFPMPSMLAMKLHVFVAGMLLAAALRATDSRRIAGLVLTAIVLPILASLAHVENHWAATVQVILIGLFTCLVFHQVLQGLPVIGNIVESIIMALDSRFMRWLGNTSYSVYLLHLLIVIPVVGVLSSTPGFDPLPGPERLLISAAITIPPVYLLAWGLHHFVEQPGIKLGKRILGLGAGRPAPASEKSDAAVTGYTK